MGARTASMIVIVSVALATSGCEARSPVGPGATAGVMADNATNARPGDSRVTLCHATGSGRYQPITVSTAAESAHRAHGDAAVGEAVPGASSMIFDENCTAVAEVTIIRSGSWMIVEWSGAGPTGSFRFEGSELVATGRWPLEQWRLCLLCRAGQELPVSQVFSAPLPMTDRPYATGSATVGGQHYPYPVAFAGLLHFEGGTLTIPTPDGYEEGSPVTLTTPFVLSGRLKGYEVAGRRDAFLVFDVPVTGRGTATLELGFPGREPFIFQRLRFEFTD